MKRFYPTILALGATCFVFQTVQATLLFSEAFNYSPGALGGNINPGNSTAWSSGSANLVVASGNLTYAGLADSGGNELQINNGVSAGTIYNTYANQTSGQIYYSFLFNAAGADSANNYFTALNPGTSTPNGGSDAIDAYFYAAGQMKVRAASLSAAGNTVLSLNQTYLIVEMLDLTARTASLWVNPSSATFGGTAPAADTTLSGIAATTTAVDNVGFKAQSSAGGPYLIDNLLIGTTWADVTPAAIPEPSTLAFAALGLLGGFTLRLRRR